MSLLIRLVVAALLSTSFVATAGRSAFNQFDTDDDGRLSRWEVQQQPQLLDRFKILDVDGNGYLSRRELDASRQHATSTAGIEN